MLKKFALNDADVVVVIGSGAGGGTLGSELAQKGVNTVILEAGGRHEIPSFENDEWGMFGQISWLDTRTTSGNWRVARDFPGLPAWIVKAVGGSTVHWAGASLRFQPHEFMGRSTYGDIPGANLLDWPITLEEMEPWYAMAEDRMGVTRTNGIEGLPGNNNFKVMKKGADKLGYKNCHTGRMAINSKARDGRNACLQIGFCFQGCKSGAKWSTLYVGDTQRGGDRKARGTAELAGAAIEHDASGKVTGVVYADSDGKIHTQKARAVCVAGNSIESPRLLLNSESSQFPDGLANSSGQVGKNYMRHMTGSVYACVRQARLHEPGHDHGRYHHRRGRQRPRAWFRRGLRDGDAVAWDPIHGRLSQSRRLGPRVQLRARYVRSHGRYVAGWRGHAAGEQRHHLAPQREGPARVAGAQCALRRPSKRHRHAQPRLPAG